MRVLWLLSSPQPQSLGPGHNRCSINIYCVEECIDRTISKSGFLSLSALNILGQIILGRGGSVLGIIGILTLSHTSTL